MLLVKLETDNDQQGSVCVCLNWFEIKPCSYSSLRQWKKTGRNQTKTQIRERKTLMARSSSTSSDSFLSFTHTFCAESAAGHGNLSVNAKCVFLSAAICQLCYEDVSIRFEFHHHCKNTLLSLLRSLLYYGTGFTVTVFLHVLQMETSWNKFAIDANDKFLLPKN